MNSPSPSTPSPELWAGIAAAAGAAFVFLRKLVSRKSTPNSALCTPHLPLTRTEFKSEMEAMRNRIGASHLALADKIDGIVTSIDRLAITTEARLDRLDSTVARLDERTKAL